MIGRRCRAVARASGDKPERDSSPVVSAVRSLPFGCLRSSSLCLCRRRRRRHGPVSDRPRDPGNFTRVRAEGGSVPRRRLGPGGRLSRASWRPDLHGLSPLGPKFGTSGPRATPWPRLSLDPAPLPLAAAQADPAPWMGRSEGGGQAWPREAWVPGRPAALPAGLPGCGRRDAGNSRYRIGRSAEITCSEHPPTCTFGCLRRT